MKALKTKFRKGTALVLALTLSIGQIPIIPRKVLDVYAEDSVGNKPSVTTFATKDELMNVFEADGTKNAIVGKIRFGRDYDQNPLEWYVLGKDKGIEGDNIAIFAATPIIESQVFEGNDSDNKLYEESFGVYESAPLEVYPNHYGASNLRMKLKELATDTDYFSETEQSFMQATTVTTNDTLNSMTYTTTDVLYALKGEDDGAILWADSGDEKILPMESYWKSASDFWLRSPFSENVNHALLGGYYITNTCVVFGHSVYPASNLKLSSALFASATSVATSDKVTYGEIEEGTAMTLRMDGSNTDIGSAVCDSEQGILLAKKSATATGSVSVVIQGNDGFKDWYYSKEIIDKVAINGSDLKAGIGLRSNVELSDCKIWIETTIDGVSYAKMTTEGTIDLEEISQVDPNYLSVTAFATREQLMNRFGVNGVNPIIGKIIYGRDSGGSPIEWYVLGKDIGVEGDNIAIFAADAIIKGQEYEWQTDNESFEESFGVYNSNPLEVYPNHYGASELREVLQKVENNTDYFTITEQSFMQATTFKTKDTLNRTEYEITDVLYPVNSNDGGLLSAGSGDEKKLPMNDYWESGGYFWLRTPSDYYDRSVLVVEPGDGIWADFDCDFNKLEVRPASNLNLPSTISYASAAKVATSGMVVCGEIVDGTAMTLRLDGSNIDMGRITYDSMQGILLAEKSETASGTVSLVIQGNDGFKDWYYSKEITDKLAIKASDLKAGLGLMADVELSACKMWIETTIDGMSYAKMANEGTIALEDIPNININFPNITAFALKDELMNTFLQDGTNSIIGKIKFGRDSGASPLEWYVLGKDAGVEGDNVAIFAADTIIDRQVLEDNNSDNKKYEKEFGIYDSVPIEVYPNHYGASDLRVNLQTLVTNQEYFTVTEQSFMQPTTIKTYDELNGIEYTTTDILYVLRGCLNGNEKLLAGSDDGKILPSKSYWRTGNPFWLRNARSMDDNCTIIASPGGDFLENYTVSCRYLVRPASNLNLSSVIFASAASSGDVTCGKIAEGTAMTLRMDGSNTDIGSVIYDSAQEILFAKKSASATGKVSVVVQGNDGFHDWYYSKEITNKVAIKASDLKKGLGLPFDVELSDCKIWIETTVDGVSYAKMATEETISLEEFTDVDSNYLSVSAFATKDELMNKFLQDGTNTTIGKIVFGRDYVGNPLEWYLLGKDAGIKGDNVVIFMASDIIKEQKFEDNYTDNKIFQEGFGEYDSKPSEVYPNHYGASKLRLMLQQLATNSDYFSPIEQSLMQATTITTNDTLNGTAYTTTDLLYALKGKEDGMKLLAGSGDKTILPMKSYWRSGTYFGLRSADSNYGYRSLAAESDYEISSHYVDNSYAVRSASNLNLSSVLFASAATVATSDIVLCGEITEGKAMTLRLDGSNMEIGTLTSDGAQGILFAKKSITALGTVSLVIQGNDGFKDWYYSKVITDEELVKASDVKTALGLLYDVKLSDCNVWIEITVDNVSYAKLVSEGTIEPEESSSQEATTKVEETTTEQQTTTTKPEESSSQETTKVEETTTEQQTTTAKPEESSSQETTTKVEETTTEAQTTTAKPEESSSQETTTEAQTTTKKSEESSSQETTKVEETTTEQQTTTAKPEESSSQETTTKVEETTTEQQITSVKPEESSSQETTKVEESTTEQQTTTAKPEESSSQETTTKVEEMTTEQQTTTKSEESSSQETTKVEESTTESTEETTTGQEESTTEPTEETTTGQEETTTKPEQVKQKLTNLSIAVSSYTYDGYAKKPTPTVKCGTKKLTKDKDYKVTYKNNVNPGTATVTVTGIGTYTGTLTKTFKINLSKVTSLKQNTSYTTSKITMAWNKVKGATGYEIYRAASKNSSYKLLKTVTANSYTQSGLKAAVKYYYKVRAYRTVNGKKVHGAYSEAKSMITKPAAPTMKLTAGSKRVKVSWTKSSGSNGYEVYMATSRNGSYTKIKSANSLQFHYTKTGLTKGKTYYFKVRAFKKTGVGVKVYSGYSRVSAVKVK